MRSHPRSLGSALLLAAALVAVGPGCARDGGPTSPELSPSSAASRPTLSPTLLDAPTGTAESAWSTVISESVLPGEQKTVAGSRYSVSFKLTSLLRPITFTVQERDPGIVDVELGPDREQFLSPVILSIDYSGTANDPASPYYRGQPPQVYWFDPATSTWIPVPGSDDPTARIYSVELKHFSRYAMGDGTGGWEDVPDPEQNRSDQDPSQRDE